MRKFLAYSLLAALSVPLLPVAALADDHHRWEERHEAREWHHHHHVYSDSYYMEHPRTFYTTPAYVAPAPVMVAPAPVYAPPPASLNVVIPIH